MSADPQAGRPPEPIRSSDPNVADVKTAQLAALERFGIIDLRTATAAQASLVMRSVRRDELVRVLPSLYCTPAARGDLATLVRASALDDPDGVVTHHAAARLTWWPELPAPEVCVARRALPSPAAGYRWHRSRIPPELVADLGGLKVTTAALTVLDLIPTLGGNAIDEALRRGAVTLPQLELALALTPHRRGNAERRWLLEDSRDQPWSEAERNLHRGLRAADTGHRFRTNHWVTLSDGRRTALDVALLDLMLAFEADGYAYHGPRSAFEYDRDRDSDLATQGWQVVRFSAAFLERGDEVVRRLRGIITRREESLTGRGASRPRS